MSPPSARLRIGLVLLVAILVQTTLGSDLRVDGVAPGPDGAASTICAGLTGGAEAGAWVGFWAGLITDLFLTSTPLGLSALTYCLVGAAVGALRTAVLPGRRLITAGGRPGRHRPRRCCSGSALGDVLGQSQLLDAGRSWLIRVVVVEAGWATVLALPVGWLYARAARGLEGVRSWSAVDRARRWCAASRLADPMSAPEPPSPHVRLTILLVVVVCLFAALFARLWFLQVINAPTAQAAAAEQRRPARLHPGAPGAHRGPQRQRAGRQRQRAGHRGEPADRQPEPVDGHPSGPAARHDRPRSCSGPSTTCSTARTRPVPIMPDATPQQILYIQENQNLFPGVQATTMSVRTYSAMGKAAANVVGYVGQIDQAAVPAAEVPGLPARRPDRPGRRRSRVRERAARHARASRSCRSTPRGNVLTTLSTTRPVPGDTLRLSHRRAHPDDRRVVARAGDDRRPPHLRHT